MGSPMRQPADESGPDASPDVRPDVSSDASSGLAYTRDEVLRAQTITATSAARMIRPGIQMRLWLGCMAFSLRARVNGLRARAITVRTGMARFLAGFFGVVRRDQVAATRIVTAAVHDCWQLTRKLQVFAVF